MGSGSGAPGGQQNVYAQGIGMQQQSGGTGYGGTPTGFEGMASPYAQTFVRKQDGGSQYFAATVVLRIVSLLLGLISLSLIASAVEAHAYYDENTGVLTTWNFKALRPRAGQYLVAIGVIVLIYEVVQLILSCISRGQTSTYAGTLFTFCGDQVLAYVMFSAATAQANDVAAMRHGDGTAEASFACTLSEWNSWCVKVEAGAAMGFLAFGTLALLALIAGYRFSRHLS